MYIRYFSLAVASLAFILCFWSCKQTKEEKTQAEKEIQKDSTEIEEIWDIPAEVDNRPLNVKVDSLRGSVEAAYKEMTENESQKFAALRSMLENTRFIKGFKYAEEVSKIRKALEETEKLRFSRETLSDGARMSAYDKKTEELIAMVQALYELTNQFEGNVSASKAAAEVISRDQDDFFFRKNYSKAVREYNELISKNRSEIEKLGEKYNGLRAEKDFQYAD
jgi:hypothetical protein